MTTSRTALQKVNLETNHESTRRFGSPLPRPAGMGADRMPAARASSTGERCACGGGCPRCQERGQPLPAGLRSRVEALQSADFSGVRVHADASAVTVPLKARAVTRGQDIYFHPGQYQPHTPAGQALIGHELAHTLQTRGLGNTAGEPTAARVSRPGDALERNADELARGATTRALAAPAGVALRSPFDLESADERARRQRLLTSISTAVNRLLRMLRTGALIENIEVPVERAGVRGIIYGAHTAGTADEEFNSYSDRDARIRRIIRSLMEMGTLYRRAPIAADFAAPTLDAFSGTYLSTVEYTVGGHVTQGSFGGPSEDWVDLQAAYRRYQIARGQTGADYDADWYYLNPTSRIITGAARGAPRASRGIGIGAYIVVPDVEHDPLNYWLLDGYRRIPRGAVIIEIWSDDFGDYYMHGDRRIDVPSPWSP